MICYYWYFKDNGFKYQPYVRNGCHDFSVIVQNLSDFVVLSIKMSIIDVILWVLIKKDAINLLNNSVLNNKEVL